MKQALLIHNPGAGDEDHLKADLVNAIEKEGFGCVYFSVKKDDSWKQHLNQADLIVIAGGDGTVRRIAKELMLRTAFDKKIPLAILPMGTANNLSLALGMDSSLKYKKLIKTWKNNTSQRFDVGVLKSADKIDFFLEGAGYGLFPLLIQKMDEVDKSKVTNTAEELTLALETLLEIIKTAPAEKYWLKADNQIHEGKCLLLEVMNIPSLGPNLLLAPKAVTDDGLFDIVLVEEDQRSELATYIKKMIKGKDVTFPYKTLKAKEVTIDCQSLHMHIDDELVLPLHFPVLMEVRENVIEFLNKPSKA